MIKLGIRLAKTNPEEIFDTFWRTEGLPCNHITNLWYAAVRYFGANWLKGEKKNHKDLSKDEKKN